ncbi:hypothetical protein ACG83_10580 [Frankia sp. R43]|nr:hypothetical protein ACG83_10580 [Frankia sp. R43]
MFGWAADASACGYYRLGLPIDALRSRGHEALVSTVLPEEWADADIIVGQRVCLPGPSATWQRLASEGRALVYEIDDDLFDLHPTNPARQVFADAEVQRRIRENAAAASLVTVTTEALAAVMREINPRVAVLPNAIPGWLLERTRPHRERLTIGWAGSATHHADVAEVAGHLRRFLARHPDVAMHLMGTDYTAALGLPTDRVRYTPWAIDVAAYLRMVDFDIGLAPLAPHAFNRSKSALRPLELGALGIPVVASEYGPYERFVRHGETGFLVRRDHEWSTHLRTLAADAELREQMGTKARALAAEHAIEATVGAWEEAYRALLQ